MAKFPLKLLLCEDQESDAFMLMRYLEKENFLLNCKRVDHEQAFEEALIAEDWDLVISDYHMPGFSAENGLAILKRSGKDIPFILISGALGEESAVNMMKAGVDDYLMKSNLIRLGAVIERVLEEVRIRKEIRLADQIRKANEEKYLAIINNSILGIFIAPLGGTIIESNKALETIFGYSRKEFRLLGRSQLFDGSGTLIMHQSPTKKKSGSVKGEFTGIKKNGEKFDCEVTIITFKDLHGKEIACTLVEDISERKNAIHETERSQRQLKELTQQIPITLLQMELSTQGTVSLSFISDGIRQIFPYLAYEPLPLTPQFIIDHTIGEDRGNLRSILYERHEETNDYKTEFRIQLNQQEIKWLELSFRQKKNADKTITRYGYLQDITVQKKILEELERQNRQLKDIAWTQSHVVRAPLSRIMGLVGLLRDGVVVPGKDDPELLNHIINSAEELDTIIKEITDKTKKLGTENNRK